MILQNLSLVNYLVIKVNQAPRATLFQLSYFGNNLSKHPLETQLCKK